MRGRLQDIFMFLITSIAVLMVVCMLTVAYIGGPARPLADNVTRAVERMLEHTVLGPVLWLSRNY